jgi:ZF-HD class homeobox domain-containing protein
MEYKRSPHAEETEGEEDDDFDEEEEEDDEEENRGQHHYTTAPAAPVGAHPQQQPQQVVHGQAHGLVGSHISAMESAAAFSRPLLPPNSFLVSQLSPPPGFQQPHHRQPQQQAHPRRPAQHPQPRRQQEAPARNGTASPPLAVTTVAAGAAEPAQWRYRECQRNHAARMGAHVLDGCCEFMPSATEGPGALACVACGCHRSFHRREAVPGLGTATTPNSYGRVMPLLLAPPHMQAPRPHVPPASPSSAPAALTESSSEELRGPAPARPPAPAHQQLAVGSASAPQAAPGKKRFRTKFTAEQKDRMREFAHRVGWRIHKPDYDAVDAFCAQVGVTRRVLKVWMHNNKHLAKMPPHESPSSQQQQQPAAALPPPPSHQQHHHYPPPPQHHQQQPQHNA